jgi:hypothetical protein
MMGGGTFNHPAMFFGENALGSLVLDIDGNTLEAKLLRETGAIDDAFTIIKGPPASETVRISSLRLVHGHVALQWNTVPGRLYQVHRCDGLGLPWSPVTQDLAGDGTPLVWSEALPPTPTNAFYRLVRRTN